MPVERPRKIFSRPSHWPYWLIVWVLLTSVIIAARSYCAARSQGWSSLTLKATMKVGTCI